MYFFITICWLILPKVIAKNDAVNLENNGTYQNTRNNNSFPQTSQNQLFRSNITQNNPRDLIGVNSVNVETYHSPGVQINPNSGWRRGYRDQPNSGKSFTGQYSNWQQQNRTTQSSVPTIQNPNEPSFYRHPVISSDSNLISQYTESTSLYNDYSPTNFENTIDQNSPEYAASYFRHPPPSTTVQRPITSQSNFNENYLNEIHSSGSNSFAPSLENGLDINTPSYFSEYQFNDPNIGAYDSSTFPVEQSHQFGNQFSGFPNQFQTYPQHNYPQFSQYPGSPHAGGGSGYSVLNGGYFDGNSGEHHKKEEFPGLAGFGKKISKLINDFIDPDKDKHHKDKDIHHKKKGGKYGDSLFGALTGYNDKKKINYKKIFGFGHG